MTGLDGIVVAETRLSRIDGEAGQLIVKGKHLDELTTLSFEEVAELLWETRPNLGPARVEAYRRLPELPDQPLPALQAALATLNTNDPDLVAATVPVALAAWNRRGQKPLEPDPQAGHVEDFLRLFHGPAPSHQATKALTVYLATVAEHGLNASTFTARVVASTGAHASDVVLAALCALKGPLHGGAPGPVLDLLDSLSPDTVEVQLRERLKNRERLMGFGHRVYRTRDPRAEVLKQAVQSLGGSPRLALAARTEDVAHRLLAEHKPDRPLRTNVEFYTAILLEALGFPREAFTALFATGRVLGWLAHAQEQRATGRLLRPRAAYVGPEPSLHR